MTSSARAAGAGLKCSTACARTPRWRCASTTRDFPEEKDVDAKLVRLARNLNAKLFTSDANLAKVASLQNVVAVNLREVALLMKAALVPGETVNLKLVREGRDKGQAIGYLPDGTMVIVTNGQALVGQQVEAQVQSTVQTGAGVLVFAEAKPDSGKPPAIDPKSP